MKVRTLVPCVGLLVVLGCMTNETQTAATVYEHLSQAPVLRLSFVVDREYDAENIVGLFRSNYPAGLESRAMSMGIAPEVARRIHSASDPSNPKR